jgi:XFP N-terminal domain
VSSVLAQFGELRIMRTNTLTTELLHKMDAYWRAANYLSAGQIYLYDNPLLKVASGSWWKLPMAAISSGDVIGSCDQIKELLGRGDIQGHCRITTSTSSLPETSRSSLPFMPIRG